MSEQGIGTTTVVQIAIVVHDIERALDNYTRILGVERPPVRITDEAEKSRINYRGQTTAARAKLAFIHLGQVDLELIEPFGGPSVWQEVLDARGECVHHIAFRVQGTDKVVEFFGENGISVTQQGHYTGGMYTYLDSAPALGVIIELLENFNQ
ncbi:MAG: VOC family protein [Anaerolineae bacterium]|nr:VOC family protein [Anaerolineae bacterium]